MTPVLGWQALGGFTVVVIAYVVAGALGGDPEGLLRLCTLLGTQIGTMGYLANKLEKNHSKIEKVEHQTNGAMDARIEQAISAALAQHQESGPKD